MSLTEECKQNIEAAREKKFKWLKKTKITFVMVSIFVHINLFLKLLNIGELTK